MITISKTKRKDLVSELKNTIATAGEIKKSDLDSAVIKVLQSIFSDSLFKTTIDKIDDLNSSKGFSYTQFCEVESSLRDILTMVADLKESVDHDIFLNDGYTLDLERFREKFKAKKLRSKYPNFNFDRLRELYQNPPKELQTNYNNETMLIDEFVFRKELIGIIQMILDHMDLVHVFTGGEGTGKSTHVSQMMYMVHYIMTEIGLITYKFDIKECFFNTLEKMRHKEDEYFNDPFRIFCLDEGNELHRQNWRDDEVQTFFQRLRRERHNQRIKFICIPVLGELLPAIVLTRVNFIVEMKTKNDLQTASLDKGLCNFYIVPRGDKIYSPLQKKELTQGEIKQALYDNLNDKSYMKGMPQEIKIKTYICNGVGAFPQELYIKELKESNKTFTVSKGISLTELEAFYLYKARISLKAQGIETRDVKYETLNKFVNRLKKFFEEDVDRMARCEKILERKEEEKALKDASK
ncbi:MAG: hypothetical protein ACOCUD_04225 [Bacillota bacterium]